MNPNKCIPVTVLLLLSLIVAGCSESGAPNPVDSTVTREELWINDIDFFASELPRRHINLFANISREEFNREVAALQQSVPQLDDAGIILGLARIVAGVGDAHTTLSMPSSAPFHVFPLQLYWFSDGLFCVATAPEYQHVLGKRLVAIGSTDVAAAYDSIRVFIPHENEMWARSQCPQALALAELLKLERLITDPARAAFSFEGVGAVTISSVPLNVAQTGVSILSTLTVPLPLYLRNPNINYWYTAIDSSRAIYCQYNRCANMGTPTFASFAATLLNFIDSLGVGRFIIDLRGNGGGNSSIARPLIDGIKARPTINRKGHLFVLIGRKTFSSAIINSFELKNETQSIFLGEPTGGKPNAYGEVQSFSLPSSGIAVQYSTKYFQLSSENDSSFNPDIVVELSSSDFMLGKDPVLSAALRYE